MDDYMVLAVQPDAYYIQTALNSNTAYEYVDLKVIGTSLCMLILRRKRDNPPTAN